MKNLPILLSGVRRGSIIKDAVEPIPSAAMSLGATSLPFAALTAKTRRTGEA